MVRRVFDFDSPDRFVAGTVGGPGARSFYLQARQGGALVSVGLEKTQVAALAGRISELLDAVEGLAGELPTRAGHDDRPLEEPTELFRVGAMALAWDATAQRVVIEAQPLGDDGGFAEVPDEAPEGPDLLRVRVEASRARDFIRRAASLVAAGRPTCPFCGQALDPTGHFCPKTSLN
ncbi:MAG: DUF3090 family protein [Chloroflexota bacterium]|nr:DUF3090 family protein [Chloroflexota bacterium]